MVVSFVLRRAQGKTKMTIKIIFKNGLSRENPWLSDIHIMQSYTQGEILIDIESSKLQFTESFNLEGIEKIEILP